MSEQADKEKFEEHYDDIAAREDARRSSEIYAYGRRLMAAEETIDGTQYDDVLTGDAGADILDGGQGDDDLWGGSGADVFNFGDRTGIDTIHDFDDAEGDVLQFSDILGGYNPGGGDVITDWVMIEDSGADSTVSVDFDGAGGVYAMTQVAILEGVTGLTDEAAIEAGGTIVI